MLDIFATEETDSRPIWLVTKPRFHDWVEAQTPATRNWIAASGFKATEGASLLVPDPEGQLDGIVFVLAEQAKANYPLARLSESLPKGRYHLTGPAYGGETMHQALSWAMGTYAFSRYKPKKEAKTWPQLVIKDKANGTEASHIANAVFLVRDLVNTPANDMGPQELEEAARKLAEDHQAEITVTVGDDLLTQNFPLIHTVGRASPRAPRLIDLTWGSPDKPKVTLVGKGVCFDSGGLNLKPGSSMDLMKKDMGGGANVLGLGELIMGARLPIRLRILVPAVENAVSGNAFRPGDVLPSRKGLNVEIGNTDAEGRLILADALSLADEESPELLIDMATLTGAARVALGPDLPPFYTDDEDFASQLASASRDVADPVWRMPLWPGYDSSLKGKVGDVNHIADTGMGGSITAALFLKRFVERASSWSHFDIYAWTPKARPGQPVGGEAQAIRALYAVLRSRYAST